MANMSDKLAINVCSYDDLLGLPSVGTATAYKIWELRKTMDVTPENLAGISHIKIEKILPLIDFRTAAEHAQSFIQSEDDGDETKNENAKTMVATGGAFLAQPFLERTPLRQQMLGAPHRLSFVRPNILDHLLTSTPVDQKRKPGDNGHDDSYFENPEVKSKMWTQMGRGSNLGRASPVVPQLHTVPPVNIKTGILQQPLQPVVCQPSLVTPASYAPAVTSTATTQPVTTVSYVTQPAVPGLQQIPPQVFQQQYDISQNQPLVQFNTPVSQNFASFPPNQQNLQQQLPVFQQLQPLVPQQQQIWQPHQRIPPQPTFQQIPVPAVVKPHRDPTPFGVDPVIEEPQQHRQSRSQPFMLKSLKFDGTDRCEDWSAFLVKFEIFAEASHWSDQEKRNQLCWCLTGTASRFGTNLIRHNAIITFNEMVEKMEQRFNHSNETDTLQVQFHSARQSPGESTDNWADRLNTLADKAFREVPRQYVQSQIITKFLQASTDKAAGKAAAMLKPKTIEEACQLVKLSQHLDSSIYGVRPKENRNYREPEFDEPSCQAMRASSTPSLTGQTVDEQMSTLMKQMTALQESTKSAVTQLREQVEKLDDRRPHYNTSEGYRQDNTFYCYNCNGSGHIARNCPKPQRSRRNRWQKDEDKKVEDCPLNK